MNCTECGGEVGANDNYCPHCGVVAPGLPTEDLEASDAPRSSSVSLEDQIDALRSTIEDLQVELGQNSGRLLALEHMFNVPGVRPAGQQPHDPQPAPASAAVETNPPRPPGATRLRLRRQQLPRRGRLLKALGSVGLILIPTPA